MKTQLLKLPFLFGVGGTIYYLGEIVCRGYSHWSMFVLSGLCFVIIGLLDKQTRGRWSYTHLMTVSSVIITSLEFFTGLIVNKWMGLNVWDYSNQPFHLMGQVCLLFSILWYFLSYAALVLDNYLRYWFFREPHPHILAEQFHAVEPQHTPVRQKSGTL